MKKKSLLLTISLGIMACVMHYQAEGHTMVCIPEKFMTQGQDQKLMRCRAHFAYTTKLTKDIAAHRCYVQFFPDTSAQFIPLNKKSLTEFQAVLIPGWSLIKAEVEENGEVSGFNSASGKPWAIKLNKWTPNIISLIRSSQKLIPQELANYLDAKPIYATSVCDLISKTPLIQNCTCKKVVKSPECGDADICFK